MRTTKSDDDTLIVAWAVVLYPIAMLTTKVISVFLDYSFDIFELLIAALALDIFVIFYISSLQAIYEELIEKSELNGKRLCNS